MRAARLADLKVPKPTRGDVIAFGYSLDNRIDHCVQRLAGGSFANVGLLGGNINQFRFIHFTSFPVGEGHMA